MDLISGITGNTQDEFEKICKDRNVFSKLNQLDELEENKQINSIEEPSIVPSTLPEPPATILTRRKLSTIETQKENLSEHLIKLEEELRVIKGEIVEQQKTKRKLETAIVAEMAPLEKALKTVGKWKDLGTKQWVENIELMTGLSN